MNVTIKLSCYRELIVRDYFCLDKNVMYQLKPDIESNVQCCISFLLFSVMSAALGHPDMSVDTETSKSFSVSSV